MKTSIIDTNLSDALHSYFPLGFQLSRVSWDSLGPAQLSEAYAQGQAGSNRQGARQLAEQINARSRHLPTTAVSAAPGDLIAMGILVDALRYVSLSYCHEQIPQVLTRALDWTARHQGESVVEQPPVAFVNLFPPAAVLQKEITEDDFLSGTGDLATAIETITVESLLVSLSNANPAFSPFYQLFDDTSLGELCPYRRLVQSLESFFDDQPVFAPLGLKLFDALRAPMLASPDSLDGQLRYIREHWSGFLPAELMQQVILAADIIAEEQQMRGYGPGPSEALRFGRDARDLELGYPEPAAFSRDADWMSNVVIIAKSAPVWLDQLSRKHGRHIRYLSDIPDEELERLAAWGFSGLWLIGVWERSSASQTIKQIMGNPEAASSAYSLYDYVIAEELGGETAYEDLRQRAWQRGIRLASDMVPNHMGIYSRWVVEHPDWFLQTDQPPFPAYQYTGVDLSPDERVTVQIEDGYWEHRDAAVVFKRIDQHTGDVRYLYHGNDGTSTPWNDTAQLNFMLPEVREAVIQTILHVARKFPIIRFDAAMTLAKKHFHRLWFPPPGDGGAIPSRAEHSLAKAAFDEAFPKEFWREVVDRVAAEQPETLLLAEAFWLMEGYFVRTLGMHRVYNSAFMNMLKMEDNAKYRTTVKNVLEFSPEVLKRLVNFMNNPDEATAVDQFGKGDKYFGIAILMVTMPGLPMFGHGQVEGFAEKYGMEYRRAYWDETVDEEMVRRHEREIFPLMRQRQLFSGADNFALYDFVTDQGWVDENVFAYSNRFEDQRALVIYNNAYNSTNGTIKTSTAINVGSGDDHHLVRRSLAEALALDTRPGHFYIFRDSRTNLEYLRSGQQLADEELCARLEAYQYHAFIDFREVYDTDGHYATLATQLKGDGCPNIDEAIRRLHLKPLTAAFESLVKADMLKELLDDLPSARDDLETAVETFQAVATQYGATVSLDLTAITRRLGSLRHLRSSAGIKLDPELGPFVAPLLSIKGDQMLTHLLLAWAILADLNARQAQDWLLPEQVSETFRQLGFDDSQAAADAALLMVMGDHGAAIENISGLDLAETLKQLIAEDSVADYLLINEYNHRLWFNRERLERMVAALSLIAVVSSTGKDGVEAADLAPLILMASQINLAAEQAGYQVNEMIRLLTNDDSPA